MSVLKDGSTLNIDGIDETPSFPSNPSPGPQAPENFYLLLSRILYYKQSRNLGGRVRSEEKKRKSLQRTTAWDSKQKGTEESQKYSKRADPPGAGTPHVELTVSHSSQL